MQRDRIGRGQRAVDIALRRHEANGPDARGCITETLPDLPREYGDGGLAAGAGDRRNGRGLTWVESRRGQRQRAARIRHGNKCNATVALRNTVADDSDSAGRNRLIDEARTIGLDTGQREENIAPLHRPAVHGNARDRNIGMLRADHGISAKKVA